MAGDFNIIRVEDLVSGVGGFNKYVRRDYWKVTLVKGNSIIRYPEVSIEIKEDALVFTNPEAPYSWERLDTAQTGYICLFTSDFLSSFGNISSFPIFTSPANSVILLNKFEAEQFFQLFLRMEKELSGSYYLKSDLMKCQLMSIIHDAQSRLPDPTGNDTHFSANVRIRALFLQALETEFTISHNGKRIKMNSPVRFANFLGLHVNHLNKSLKSTTGHTTSELIDMRMILEAKLLLLNSDWSVKEIAWILGFNESNHFSTFFKHQQKVTPREFRKLRND